MDEDSAAAPGALGDVAGYLLRVRRRADLSQRDLAARLGVSPAAVAMLESGERVPRLDQFQRILGLAGLRLAVVDEQGAPVAPFDPDSVRDNAGRRFPAHLDVAPPDRRPDNRGAGERYDRPPTKGWYARREERDWLVGQGVTRPEDHPTAADLERARLTRLYGGPKPPIPDMDPPCSCPLDCFDHHGCLPECPCQCEPPNPLTNMRARLWDPAG